VLRFFERADRAFDPASAQVLSLSAALCASAATTFASSDKDRRSSASRCRGSARRSATCRPGRFQSPVEFAHETFLPRFVSRVRRVRRRAA
jgi:hypothetical protein